MPMSHLFASRKKPVKIQPKTCVQSQAAPEMPAQVSSKKASSIGSARLLYALSRYCRKSHKGPANRAKKDRRRNPSNRCRRAVWWSNIQIPTRANWDAHTPTIIKYIRTSGHSEALGSPLPSPSVTVKNNPSGVNTPVQAIAYSLCARLIRHPHQRLPPGKAITDQLGKGAIFNFTSFIGTGAGSTSQETSEIDFSEKAEST